MLKLPIAQVLAASTGVIGVELDAKLIVGALPRLVAGLAEDGFSTVARAIMTTDLAPKEAYGQVKLRRGTVRIAGMTKGSGMIQPRMATTLGFVLTDADIPVAMLRRMLRRGVERSYNRLSVDGDTSTNDTLVLLANGASGVRPDPKEMAAVEERIAGVMEDLARSIARDGEGAKKLITIMVSGAPTDEAAVRIARSIANSPLVKTAFAGADPNWGRILAAAGRAGVKFDPSRVNISIAGATVCRRGCEHPFDERAVHQKMLAKHVPVRVDLHAGSASARVWTCDFTIEYVHINSSYRT
jgi:glutamate N-acetyltransferase/amino-acid N-acetyltransferase